jgi:2-(1,2-epoxy-1,2-dihydrophenyl)acetyl-CoA isomerase
MTYENILYTLENNVAAVTINRPQTYNALSMGTLKELTHAFKSAAKDDDIRAMILTGAGKGFSSGADLPELGANLDTVDITEALRQGLNTLAKTMRGLEKPIIAAINGVAAGAGASLPLMTDYRIASTQASFVFAAFVNIGIIPDAGGTYLLQQLVGTGKALELYLTADAKNRVTAEQAHAYGIVNQVVEPDDLLSTATEFAEKLAKMPTKAIGWTKRAVYRAYERTLPDALEYEALMQGAAFRTEDFREGINAFLEKREPQFKGK